jgi:hypothetical protein
MANILPYGGERSSDGDAHSLIQKAREQDVDRSVRKDDEYCRTHGVNKAFNEIPRDVVVPCDASRLDVRRAGEYPAEDNDISILNPKAYAAFVRRAQEIEEHKKQIEIDEYQKILQEAHDNYVNPIAILSLDLPDFA